MKTKVLVGRIEALHGALDSGRTQMAHQGVSWLLPEAEAASGRPLVLMWALKARLVSIHDGYQRGIEVLEACLLRAKERDCDHLAGPLLLWMLKWELHLDLERAEQTIVRLEALEDLVPLTTEERLDVLGSQSLLHIKRGETDQAERVLQRRQELLGGAQARSTNVGKHQALQSALEARLAFGLGQATRCITRAKEASEQLRSLGIVEGLAHTETLVAAGLTLANQHQAALQHLRSCLETTPMFPVDKPVVLNAIGEAHRRLDQLEDAKRYLTTAVDLDTTLDGSTILLNLALLALTKGQAQEANELLGRRKGGQDEPSIIAFEASLQLGVHLMLGETVMAWSWLRRLEAVFNATGIQHVDILRATQLAASAAQGLTSLLGKGIYTRALVMVLRLQRAMGVDEAAQQRTVDTFRGAKGPVSIGPFLLTKEIDAGGSSVVYEGMHGDTGKVVAIKVLTQTESAGAQTLDKEVHTAAALDHPHIIRMYDTGRVPNITAELHPEMKAQAPWTAMAYLPYGNLAEELPGYHQLLGITEQLLDALVYMHGRGVLHLDIKPANILWGDADRTQVQLVDLGLALHQTASKRPIAGTIYYMAPEQFEGAELDTWTDLYGLAATLWHLLFGAPPHPSPTPKPKGAQLVKAWRQIKSEPPAPPLLANKAPADVLRWLLRLLQPTPERRFQTALEARHAFEAATGRTAVSSPNLPATAELLGIIASRRPRLVARHRPLKRLHKRHQHLTSARPPLLVDGAQGIGKRALVAHFSEVLISVGVPVFVAGQAWPGRRRLTSPQQAASEVAASEQPPLVIVPPEAQAGPWLKALAHSLCQVVGITQGEHLWEQAQVWREHGADLLTLRRMNDEETNQLCDQLLPMSDELKLSLNRKADGNPGLLRELINDLAHKSLLVVSNGSITLLDHRPLQLPQRTRDRWQRWCDTQTSETVEALTYAAAMGELFSRHQWQLVCPHTTEQAAQIAIDNHLLRPVSGDGLGWIQPGLRWLLMESDLIRSCHRRLARRLTAIEPGAAGMHWAKAGLIQRGLHLLLDGAELSLSKHERDDASQLVQQARAIAQQTGLDPATEPGRKLAALIRALDRPRVSTKDTGPDPWGD